jgi:choline dehydrogenase
MKAQYDALTTLLEPEDAHAGWDWDGLFAYMKKVRARRCSFCDRRSRSHHQSEHFVPPNATQRAAGANAVDAYHGFGGPVHAGFPAGMFLGPEQPFVRHSFLPLFLCLIPLPICTQFAETARNLTGMKLLPDVHGGDADGVVFAPIVRMPSSLNLGSCALTSARRA